MKKALNAFGRLQHTLGCKRNHSFFCCLFHILLPVLIQLQIDFWNRYSVANIDYQTIRKELTVILDHHCSNSWRCEGTSGEASLGHHKASGLQHYSQKAFYRHIKAWLLEKERGWGWGCWGNRCCTRTIWCWVLWRRFCKGLSTHSNIYWMWASLCYRLLRAQRCRKELNSSEQIVNFIYVFWEGHKICKMFTLLLSYVVPVKSKVKISQNFVAFPEYMNFMAKAEADASHLHDDLRLHDTKNFF